MDKKRLILALGLAALAFLIFTQGRRFLAPAPVVMETPVTPVVEEVPYVDVLVANADIPFGTRINEDHLRWREWPEESVTEYLITNVDRPQAITDLTGAVVKTEMFEGEPISDRKIVMPGERGLMAALLKPGMRAVTTRISVDTAAGGFIQPGDHVDIILTRTITADQGQGPGANNGPQYSAQTIFDNVRVLAIDQTFSTSSEAGAAVVGSTATFEMTQGDAELLQQAVAEGDLTLTLRPTLGSYDSSARSSARMSRNTNSGSTLMVYRNGQQQQIAIRE